MNGTRALDMLSGVALGAAIVLAAGLIPNLDRAIHPPMPAEVKAPAQTEPTVQTAELAQKLDQVNAGLNALIAAKAEELAALKSVDDLTPAPFRALVVKAAEDHGLDPRLLAALGYVETGGTWNPELRGAAGEWGLTQILPATAQNISEARGIPIPDLTDAATNLDWGAWYLAALLEEAGGNVTEALRQYNAGPRWMERAPNAARGYSRRVLELYDNGRQ